MSTVDPRLVEICTAARAVVDEQREEWRQGQAVEPKPKRVRWEAWASDAVLRLERALGAVGV